MNRPIQVRFELLLDLLVVHFKGSIEQRLHPLKDYVSMVVLELDLCFFEFTFVELPLVKNSEALIECLQL